MSNNIQAAAQAAANQAAEAAAKAQMSPHSPDGGIPQTQSIMGNSEGGDTANDVETMMNAQPLPQTGQETVPTAQNGMLYDDVSAPQNNPNKTVPDFNTAKSLFAELLENPEANLNNLEPASNQNDANNLGSVDKRETFNNIPTTTPEDLIDDVPQLIDPAVLESINNNNVNEGHYPYQGNIPNMNPEGLDNIQQMLVDAITQVATGAANPQANQLNEPESHDLYDPELEINSEDFMERFSEDPVKAISEVANQIAAQRISEMEAGNQELRDRLQPLLQESERIAERNQSVKAMEEFLQKGQGQYNDFNDYADKIAKIMREDNMPFTDSRSFETAYLKAKMPTIKQRLEAAESQKGKTLADFMTEEESINEIVNDPRITQMIIERYLQNLQNGSSPQVINGGGNTLPLGTAPPKANSLQEAGKLFEATFK